LFLAMATVMLFAVSSNFASVGKLCIALAVMALGLLSANSRGAFVALAIGLPLLDLYRRRYSELFVKVAAGAGLFLIVVAAAQFSTFFASVLGKGTGEAGSADYRWLLWHRGLEEIAKHPFFGTSLQTAMDHLEDLRQGEDIIDLVNGYINYGLTAGYPGMVALLLVFVSLSIAMLAMRRGIGSSQFIGDAAGAVFGISTFSILSTFYGGFGGESTPFYMICALGSAAWALRRSAATDQYGAGTVAVRTTTPTRALIEADRAAAQTRSFRLRRLDAVEPPAVSAN